MTSSASENATLDEIESVYRTRLPELRRVAAAIVGDRELALDAVQEGFALAVRQRDDFRGAGPLEAWVWRIVVNTARSHRRHRARPRALAELPVARDNGRSDDADERVRAAVSVLPERQRLVLFLRYYADLDYRAIGDVLEISSGTVGATLTAAHSTLRETLGEVRR